MTRTTPFVILLLALALAACQTTTPTPSIVGTPAIIGTPSGSTGQLAPVPEPSANDLMTVTGILTYGADRRPIRNTAVFLADILPDANGTPTVASYSRDTSPYGITNDLGQFIITDVPAKPYQLILDTFSETMLLQDPLTGLELDTPIVPGGIANLGTLHYPSMPITIAP